MTNSDEIILQLPNIEDENLTEETTLENSYETENEVLKIAILIDKKRFFKYLPSLLNSIDAYLLYKDIDFKVKVFDLSEGLNNLETIEKNYDNIFIFSTKKDKEFFEQFVDNEDVDFYFPILNINQVDLDDTTYPNLFFGGLDFGEQILKLSSLIENDNVYVITENNFLSNNITENEKDILMPKRVFNYPINYKKLAINNSYLFLNTKVVNSVQILSNLTYHRIKPILILSTQINYNPLIFAFTSPEDTKNMIIANSINFSNMKLLDINLNLSSDLKFNWLNYSTNLLLNKAYINEEMENSYFLNDFNLYIFDNQVNYKTKLFKIYKNGFIEIE